MSSYKKLYFKLFSAITDALEAIEDDDPWLAYKRLMLAQQETEEQYMSWGEKTSGQSDVGNCGTKE